MNNGAWNILQRGAMALVPLLFVALVPDGVAQNQRPGVPRSWQGKPGETPPSGVPTQWTPPAGAPAATTHPMPVSTASVGKKTEAGEQFFIVASLDLQKSQLLLKYPTEVTLLVLVNNATKFFDESGRPINLSDLRAGDTVWLASSPSGPGQATALRIRRGQMTVADLHRYYLDYPEIK